MGEEDHVPKNLRRVLLADSNPISEEEHLEAMDNDSLNKLLDEYVRSAVEEDFSLEKFIEEEASEVIRDDLPEDKILSLLDRVEDIFELNEDVAMIDSAPVNLSMEYEELDEEYIEKPKEVNKSNLETAWEWIREKHELGFECEVPEMNTQEFINRFLKFQGNGVLRDSAGKFLEYRMKKKNLEPEDFGVCIEKFDLHF